MNYWDASALVPLVLKEASSEAYRTLARKGEVVTWWGSAVECASAIERRARAGEASHLTATARRNLDHLTSSWREIYPSESLRRAAMRFLRSTTLRAADALHLAAALVASAKALLWISYAQQEPAGSTRFRGLFSVIQNNHVNPVYYLPAF